MFKFFRKTNKDKEITENPGILFSSDIDTSEIKVHGLKLQDRADLIPLEKVSTTTFEQAPSDAFTFPNGVTKLTWKDNKVFYDSRDGLKEYQGSL